MTEPVIDIVKFNQASNRYRHGASVTENEIQPYVGRHKRLVARVDRSRRNRQKIFAYGDDLWEADIQRAVFEHLRQRGVDGIFAFHPKNGSTDMAGRKSGIYYALGLEPGTPDVIIFQKLDQCSSTSCVGRCVRIYALELKRYSYRNKNPKRLERRQEECRARMAALGIVTGIAYGLDEAIAWLEGCGLLKGTAQSSSARSF